MPARTTSTFGALLKHHRLAAGLTQAALAERAGVSAHAVSDLERDPARLPRLASVALLADALALAPDQRATLIAAARPLATPASALVPPQPETRYARSGDVSVAYQVLGDGPPTLVLVPGATSHVEWMWAEPAVAREFRHLAALARLIRFDKRGTGLSDRVPGAATLEERMDDIRAVMDAADADRAVLYGVSEGAPLAILFAATYPERTLGLIVYGGGAAWVRQPDYPWPLPAAEQHRDLDARALTIHRDWGRPERIAALVAAMGPSRVGDERFARWFAALERLGASPGGAIANQRRNLALDVRQVLPAIRVPALVLHHIDDRVKVVAEGRYLADHIPGARFVALPGATTSSSPGTPRPASPRSRRSSASWARRRSTACSSPCWPSRRPARATAAGGRTSGRWRRASSSAGARSG